MIDNTETLVHIVSIPKKKLGIKKIRGFKRVISLGYEYEAKLIDK